MKATITTVLLTFILLFAFGQTNDYWNQYKNSTCLELSNVTSLYLSTNQFEFRIIKQGSGWGDQRSDEIFILERSKNKKCGKYFHKEVLSDNVYSDFKMIKIKSKNGFDTLYNFIIKSYLVNNQRTDTLHVVADTANGYPVPFIPADDGIGYFIEIKYQNKTYFHYCSNPEIDSKYFEEGWNGPKNYQVIYFYKAIVDLLTFIRKETNIKM